MFSFKYSLKQNGLGEQLSCALFWRIAPKSHQGKLLTYVYCSALKEFKAQKYTHLNKVDTVLSLTYS